VSQIRDVGIERVDGHARRADRDRVVVEAPLVLRAQGTPVATIMRTPGHDLELVRGLLHAESVAAAAITQVEDDTVELEVPASAFAGRGLLSSAACGVCGRVAIADLELRAREVAADTTIAASVLATLPDALRAAQSVRLGYELAQKAIRFGAPVLAAVSAPSSLAIELAERFNVALVGFVRGQRANVYSHAWRIR
jgi:FdhD protein